MAKKKTKEPVGLTDAKIDIPDFEATIVAVSNPDLILKTYPNDEKKAMVKLIGHIGPFKRPVYEDSEGSHWVKGVCPDDDSYYEVCTEKIDFLN